MFANFYQVNNGYNPMDPMMNYVWV